MNFMSKLLPALKHKLVIPILSIIVLAALIGVTTYQVTKAEISVMADGEVTAVQTHADTVEEVLNDLNIEVNEHDALSHAKDELITSGMEINYKKAEKITVSINGENKDYYTTKETVNEFLDEANIQLSEHDEISHDMKDEIEVGTAIDINKAYQVVLNDAGEEEKVWTTGGTVGELLKEKDVEIGELDRVKPEASDNLSKDTKVTITRVEKVTDIVEETKDYSVVKRKDNDLQKGKEKVVSEGEEGVIAKHYEVVFENGEEVSRELIKEEVKKESKQRVVAVGNKEVNYTVSRGSGGEGVKEYLMTATVYTEQCNGCSGITSTGIDLRNAPNTKVVAVDPNVIPLGSRVWVEGYGEAIAGDVGGAIKGNRIDLFKHSSVYNGGYGHRQVKVKVYGK